MIKAYTTFLLALLALSVSTFESHAQKVIRVAAVQIPLMVESPTKGLFIELLDEVSKRSGLVFEIKVYPGNRAHTLFGGKQVDMVLPFPKGNRSHNGMISKSIYTKRDFVFVRKGHTIPRSLAELEGMRLGITAQYRYKPSLYKQQGIILEKAQSDELNMRKLSKGRIDGFLVEEHSGQAAMEKTEAFNIVYDSGHPIFMYEAVMLMQNEYGNQEYMSDINKALMDLYDDGTYFKILNQPVKKM